MFVMKATRTPPIIPGTENAELCIKIMRIRYDFLKPRDLSIPYSYVFSSTSESIREYKSIADNIPRKTITVSNVESRKSFIRSVLLNCSDKGIVMVLFAFSPKAFVIFSP